MSIFKRWARMIEASKLLDQMEERLAEHQKQIEVMADALNQKDASLLEFVHRLHETMGGEERLECEADALAQLRMLRENSDKYLGIVAVMNDRYDASDALMKRLACAMGCSQWDTDSLVTRANVLATAQTRAIQAEHDLSLAEQEISDLKDDLGAYEDE